MSTVGFSKAFESAVPVRLSWNPVLDVKISTPASLAIMKLVAWDEKYPERADDAKDVLFLMKEYINAGNDTRLYAQDADIRAMKDFDYDMASPRLLGRDMRKVADTEALIALRRILDEETKDDSYYRLVLDMTYGELNDEGLFEDTLNLVKQLRAGAFDIDMTNPTCSSSDD
ncbi:MAG: hypothetical protein ACE5IO_10875 [Thermoplasmata archaeon]